MSDQETRSSGNAGLIILLAVLLLGLPCLAGVVVLGGAFFFVVRSESGPAMIDERSFPAPEMSVEPEPRATVPELSTDEAPPSDK